MWYRERDSTTKGRGAAPVVQIAKKFEHLLEVYLPGADGKSAALAQLGPCRVHRLGYAGVVA